MLPFTLKTTAKLAQYHHMTSHQEKDFSHIAVRAAESQTTPSQGALPPLELERQTRRDSTDLHTFILFWCLDITVVQIDPLVPRVLGLKSPCSHLKDSMEATGWTNGGTINTNQCLVRIPLSEHTSIH